MRPVRMHERVSDEGPDLRGNAARKDTGDGPFVADRDEREQQQQIDVLFVGEDPQAHDVDDDEGSGQAEHDARHVEERFAIHEADLGCLP